MGCGTFIAIPLLLAALLGGCAADTARPLRPAPLVHLVFVTLADKDDVPALIRDCEELLATIPSVRSFSVGPPVEAGRGAMVVEDYHVALSLGFDDVEGYSAYLTHPGHLEILRRWQPRMASAVARDFSDGLLPP